MRTQETTLDIQPLGIRTPLDLGIRTPLDLACFVALAFVVVALSWLSIRAVARGR